MPCRALEAFRRGVTVEDVSGERLESLNALSGIGGVQTKMQGPILLGHQYS